ncbi:hypothetical protein M409DRAFT_67111 [Zasmidium cellare ATCC 36951]|uniref:Methyltransferase n=1 Tax=Zasmidium cellare ATCC 36951 TaxID=1080233 RepID=A0A6A6CIJ5_ZASCE|nr:uncharacterized protein M409DRAFT_67111 [Zasmidium cellare ATCC 36951]KAF2165782.1 hypothetical protein M409DRAFT_67111 [Zasmidium cellare ATCC 36951]
MASAGTSRNVRTELNYSKPVEGNTISIDFTKPGAEAKFEDLNENGSTSHDVTINDVRGKTQDLSLASNGFQYVSHDVAGLGDCKTEQEITDLLLPATKELVQNQLGASRIDILTSRIRSKYSTDPAKRQEYRGPANSVHSDFTPAGALKQLENVITDAEERQQLIENHRVYVINVWRPLKPITRDPLAVCDWQTVDRHRDWISKRFIYPGNWSELGTPVYHPDHRWYWISNQRPNEALVFVQFDGDKVDEGGMTVAHTAFVDPDFNEGPPRESMEIKMFAFVPRV